MRFLVFIFTVLTAHIASAGIFSINTGASDKPTLLNPPASTSYDDLIIPSDPTPRNSYVYAVDIANGALDVYKDDTTEDYQLSFLKRFKDADFNNKAVITGINKVVPSRGGSFLFIADKDGTDNALYATYRGGQTSGSEPGEGLALAKFKKTGGTAQFWIDEIKNITIKDLALSGNGQQMVLIGTKASKNTMFLISGISYNRDKASPEVNYSDVVEYAIPANLNLDAPNALDLPISSGGVNQIYVTNNSTTDTNDGVFQFEYAIENNAPKIKFKGKHILKNPTDVKGYTVTNSKGQFIYDNIFVSGQPKSASGAEKYGIVLYRHLKTEPFFNKQRTLINNEDGRPDIGEISRLALPGNNLLFAASKQGGKVATFSLTNGVPFPIKNEGNAFVKVSGDSQSNNISTPRAVVFSGSKEVIYVSGDSSDASNKGVVAVTRVADLEMSLVALNRKIEPGRFASFKVSVKNKGKTDVPLLRLNVSSSHPITQVSGPGASACQAPYTLCDPQQVLKAGESYSVTFSSTPRNIGKTSLRVNVSSRHEIKGASSQLSQVATIKVGDYNNGTLAFSLWSGLVLLILTLTRKCLRHDD